MRFLVLLLGLVIVGYLGYRAMYGTTAVDQATPKEKLDNVKSAAKRIEADQQQAADEALEKATAE